jgi:hypothetical protein
VGREGEGPEGARAGMSDMPTGLPIHQYQYFHPSKSCINTNTNDISLPKFSDISTPMIFPFRNVAIYQHQ